MSGGAFATCVLIFLDAERFLDEAIRSVVGQVGCDDWELVLVDDGSTDGSTVIAERWAATDRRIRYLDHPGHANLGMSASRNAGVAAARGRYIGFLDSDDVWLPSRLAHGRRVIAARPGAAVAIGGTWRWHGWTGALADVNRDHLMPLPAVAPDEIVVPPDLFAAIYGDPGQWRVPAMCSLLIEREALRDLGGMEAEFRGLYEDQVLYTKLALHLPAVVDARPAALYRQHIGSVCERLVIDGTWRRDGPSALAFDFLDWMLRYVEAECGADSAQAETVRRNIEHGGWWPDPPAPRWPWLSDPVRRAARTVRDRRRPPPQSVVGAWSEQALRVVTAAMRGRVLVATGAARCGEPWVDSIPATAWSFDAEVVGRDLDTAEGRRYDHVVALSSATEGREAESLVQRAVEVLRPGGSAAIIVLTPLAGVERLAAGFVGATVSVEMFGNAATRTAAAYGVAAAAVGVELDRHDPATPVLAAITVAVPA